MEELTAGRTDDAAFQDLMRRVRDGSTAAAHELLTVYGPHLLTAVRRRLDRRLRSRFDSLDFVQDVWASFFAEGARRYAFDHPGQLVGYLTKVARYKVTDVQRQQLYTQKYNKGCEQPLEYDDEGQGPALIAQQPTPSQIVMGEEEWEMLLRSQPRVYRQVLILYRQGEDQESIARKLGITSRTVSRVLSRVRSRVQLADGDGHTEGPA